MSASLLKCKKHLRTIIVCLLVYAIISLILTWKSAVEKSTVRLLKEGSSIDDLNSPNDPDVNLIAKLFNLTNPGDLGTPVLIDVNRLPREEAEKYNRSIYSKDISTYVSSLVPVRRPLPDIRIDGCASIYSNLSLPMVSVVIIFHNEHWSTLLRTIHSVTDNSPDHLIQEIILVDDLSTDAVLQEPLENYIRTKFQKVRIVRAHTRQGLIRARNLGFSESSAPVVVFLDSHCECFPGWLEPLVARIAENETIISTPNLHAINSLDFQVHVWDMTDNLAIPVLTFPKLFFKWTKVFPRELRRRDNYTEPIRAPAMVGCVIAISRVWFKKLGMFDPGLKLWGGENTEMSLKTWMCGGSMEILPCSNVAHLYHQHLRTQRWNYYDDNVARVAKVWMSESKFLSRVSGVDGVRSEDIEERVLLKENLKCRPFQHYLDHVNPEMYIRYDGIYSGQIRPVLEEGLCLNANSSRTNPLLMPYLMSCNLHDNQLWDFTEMGEIRTEYTCLDLGFGVNLGQYKCHGQLSNQLWSVESVGGSSEVKLRHLDMCVTADSARRRVFFSACASTQTQLWLWEKKRESRLVE